MEKRPIILVVDDKEPILKLLRVSLSVEGYDVITACDGISALGLLEEYKPDLAILDIMMPGKSGVELLPEIQARFPDTAVIMATAISDTTTAIHCMKEGAYDYLTKPFDVHDVVLTVGRVLERRRPRLENRAYQQNLQQKVEKLTRKVRDAFFCAMTALAYALEAKDIYTSGHSQRVAELSAVLASELSMSREHIEKIRLAGLLHDIGKIGIRESVLNKTGKLTDEEFEHIKLHPDIGARILTPVVEDKSILDAVRNHHERQDGNGYPDGLQGNQIPLEARILMVADTYDAMTSARPYRKAISSEKACVEIKRYSGSQFAPEVVEVFLKNCLVPINA